MVILQEQTKTAPAAGTGREKEQAVQRMFSSIARYYDLNNSVLSLGLHHRWKRRAIEYLVGDPPYPRGEKSALTLLSPSRGEKQEVSSGEREKSPPHPYPLIDPLHLESKGSPGERESLMLGPEERDSILAPRGRDSVKLVLDVGAGTGDLALLAARRLSGTAQIIAADLNYPMLAVGARKIHRAQLEQRILSVQANAERICAADGTFDAVMTGFCLRNVADLSLALREIHRVLRIGGRLICLEFSRPSAPWLRRLYDWYSFSLLPWVGTKISGDRTGVYQYLPASIRSFPDQEGLAQTMRSAGFDRVEYCNLSGGIVAIHIAVK